MKQTIKNGKEELTVVMERLNTTLEKVMNESGPCGIQVYRKDVNILLNKLHELDICHGDLNLGNIGITKDGKVVLIDFGSSFFGDCKNQKQLKVLVGTNKNVKRVSNFNSFQKIFGKKLNFIQVSTGTPTRSPNSRSCTPNSSPKSSPYRCPAPPAPKKGRKK